MTGRSQAKENGGRSGDGWKEEAVATGLRNEKCHSKQRERQDTATQQTSTHSYWPVHVFQPLFLPGLPTIHCPQSISNCLQSDSSQTQILSCHLSARIALVSLTASKSISAGHLSLQPHLSLHSTLWTGHHSQNAPCT